MAKKFVSYAKLSRYDVLMKQFVNSLITAANGDIAALQSAIDLLNGDAAGSVNAKITAAFNDFTSKISDDGVVNSYKELIDYVAAHGAEFTTLVGQVTALENAVGKPAAEGQAATGLYKAIADALASANGYTDTEVGKEKTRAELAESGLAERISDLEDKFSGEGSVEDQIATAKQEAIDAAAEDASTKMNGLKETAISASAGEDIVVTLGGKVGAPTIGISFDWATDEDIDALFAEEEAGE